MLAGECSAEDRVLGVEADVSKEEGREAVRMAVEQGEHWTRGQGGAGAKEGWSEATAIHRLLI
jgi:hypothetical protein